MARTDNLTNYLTDVANAIRTKKGTEGNIAANTFDDEILSIQSGIALNGIVKAYEVEAGNNINAGDFVKFVNKKYNEYGVNNDTDLTTAINSNISTSLYGFNDVSAVQVSDNIVAIWYVVWNGKKESGMTISSGGSQYIGSLFIKNNTIQVNTPTQISNNVSSEYNHCSNILPLTNNRFLMCYSTVKSFSYQYSNSSDTSTGDWCIPNFRIGTINSSTGAVSLGTSVAGTIPMGEDAIFVPVNNTTAILLYSGEYYYNCNSSSNYSKGYKRYGTKVTFNNSTSTSVSAGTPVMLSSDDRMGVAWGFPINDNYICYFSEDIYGNTVFCGKILKTDLSSQTNSYGDTVPNEYDGYKAWHAGLYETNKIFLCYETISGKDDANGAYLTLGTFDSSNQRITWSNNWTFVAPSVVRNTYGTSLKLKENNQFSYKYFNTEEENYDKLTIVDGEIVNDIINIISITKCQLDDENIYKSNGKAAHGLVNFCNVDQTDETELFLHYIINNTGKLSNNFGPAANLLGVFEKTKNVLSNNFSNGGIIAGVADESKTGGEILKYWTLENSGESIPEITVNPKVGTSTYNYGFTTKDNTINLGTYANTSSSNYYSSSYYFYGAISVKSNKDITFNLNTCVSPSYYDKYNGSSYVLGRYVYLGKLDGTFTDSTATESTYETTYSYNAAPEQFFGGGVSTSYTIPGDGKEHKIPIKVRNQGTNSRYSTLFFTYNWE